MILYGECIGTDTSAAVRISALAEFGCDLEASDDSPAFAAPQFDGECALWIGAVGPIQAMAIRKDAAHLALRFKQPIDGAILHHFSAA